MKTIMSSTFHDYKTYSKVNQHKLFLSCSHASIFILLIQRYPLHIQDKKRFFWANSSRCILFYCKIILLQFRFSMWKIVLLKDLVYENIWLRCFPIFEECQLYNVSLSLRKIIFLVDLYMIPVDLYQKSLKINRIHE